LKKNVAIYPGSFDPPTNGHLDLIERGHRIFDELIVAILQNPGKEALFTLAERRKMLRTLTARWPNVRVDTFDGLLVDYARKVKADVVLRGIRAISDYEYELQMALMNRKLSPKLETVFMMPAEAYSYLSSRLVKEIVTLGGSINGLVPSVVAEQVRERVKHNPHKLQRPENAEGMNGEPAGRHGNHRRDGVQEAGRALGAASRKKGRS
jgi:pantetheine-phosphate adenylyltransferase